MTTVISAIHQKGGQGKTTACFNLATMLAHSGYKVAVIDFDVKPEASLREYSQRSLSKAMEARGDTWDNAWYDERLFFVEESPTKWADVMDEVECLDPDFIFCDFKGDISDEMTTVMRKSDHIITPIKPEDFGYNELDSVCQLLNSMPASRQPRKKITVLPVGLSTNRFRAAAKLREIKQEVARRSDWFEALDNVAMTTTKHLDEGMGLFLGVAEWMHYDGNKDRSQKHDPTYNGYKRVFEHLAGKKFEWNQGEAPWAR